MQLRWQEFLRQIRHFNDRVVESFHRTALLQPIPGLISYCPRDPHTLNSSAATSEATLSRLNPGDSYPEAAGRFSHPVRPSGQSALAARHNALQLQPPPIVTHLNRSLSGHEQWYQSRYLSPYTDHTHAEEAAPQFSRIGQQLAGLGEIQEGEETEEYDAASTGPTTPQSAIGGSGHGDEPGAATEQARDSQPSRKRIRSPRGGDCGGP